MGSLHQISLCSKELERDAHSLHLSLPYSLNHLQQQYAKTTKLKESKSTILNRKLVYMQMTYYYAYKLHPNHSTKRSMSSTNCQKSLTTQSTEANQLYFRYQETMWTHNPSLSLNTGNIKYLGISIFHRLSKLYSLNYCVPPSSRKQKMIINDGTSSHSHS